MKRIQLLTGFLTLALILPNASINAADFNVPANTTDNTAKTVSGGQTGNVEEDATLSVGGGTTTIGITGTGTAIITNSGEILQTGTGRTIDNTGGGNSGTRLITNFATGVIQSADGDTIRINRSDSNITLDNYGIIRSLNASAGGSQALDFNAITTGTNIVNNWGLIIANAADSVRPGTNGIINNWGTISAIPVVEVEDGLNVVSGSDGIDAQTRTGVQVFNYNTITGRHGITGEDGGSGFTISVTNYEDGNITGVNGSGINIDESTSFANITNYGTITGIFDFTVYDVGDGDGVDVDGLVNLQNYGVIQGINAGGLNDGSLNNSEGISIGGGTIINHIGAVISGENNAGNSSVGNGILVDDSNDGSAFASTIINNSGLIHGKSGFGVKIIGTFSDLIENNSTGTIRGAGLEATLQTGGGDDLVINRGAIISENGKAIDLGTGNDTLRVLGPQASIVGDVSGGGGTNALIINASGGTFVYADSFTNFLTADFQGGKVILTGFSSITGKSTISGGILALNGTLQTPLLHVLGGGTLMGNGTVIGNVLNGGTVAPGNSIGLLTILGNYTQTRQGTLQIEVGSVNNHDVLVVSGTAVLDGTLEIASLGYQAKFGDRIPFLRAGRITGTFDTIEVPDSDVIRGRFLNLGNTGVLLIAPASYTAVAETPNQTRVAAALDNWIGIESGDIGAVTLALDLLREDQYPQAFEAIMPGFHDAALSTAIELSHSQGQLLHQQLSARRISQRGSQTFPPAVSESSAKGGKSTKSVKAIAAPQIQPESDDYRWSTWFQGSGLFSSGGLSLAPGENFESGTFIAGADYALSDHFALGIFAGYSEGWGDYDNGGEIDLERILFGAYATVDIGNFYLNTALGIGTVDHDINRPIQFATLNRSASSEPDGHEFFALLGGGYDFRRGNWTFGPQASVQYSKVSLDSFTETGADSLNLRLNDPESDSLRSHLGARVAYTIQATDRVAIIPELRAFWQHEFLDGDSLNAGLNGGDGPNFNFESERDDKDALFIGAGLGLQVGPRFYANLYYNVDLGRNDPNHNISISATIRF